MAIHQMNFLFQRVSARTASSFLLRRSPLNRPKVGSFNRFERERRLDTQLNLRGVYHEILRDRRIRR